MKVAVVEDEWGNIHWFDTLVQAHAFADAVGSFASLHIAAKVRIRQHAGGDIVGPILIIPGAAAPTADAPAHRWPSTWITVGSDWIDSVLSKEV